ncbi:MAG: hypothetical protein ACR2RF_22895, partial [Geminicoccaceae bacterium]
KHAVTRTSDPILPSGLLVLAGEKSGSRAYLIRGRGDAAANDFVLISASSPAFAKGKKWH